MNRVFVSFQPKINSDLETSFLIAKMADSLSIPISALHSKQVAFLNTGWDFSSYNAFIVSSDNELIDYTEAYLLERSHEFFLKQKEKDPSIHDERTSEELMMDVEFFDNHFSKEEVNEFLHRVQKTLEEVSLDFHQERDVFSFNVDENSFSSLLLRPVYTWIVIEHLEEGQSSVRSSHLSEQGAQEAILSYSKEQKPYVISHGIKKMKLLS